MPPELVLFDGACGLCRSLAELASKRSAGALRFAAWEDFKRTAEGQARLAPEELGLPAARLRVLTAAGLLTGEGAWSFLLGRYDDLAGLNWLASRLGVSRQAATALERTAGLFRRFCRGCGKT